MNIFPAIDLYGSNAVRLYKGDYEKMTVYSTDPVSVAEDFKDQGAEYIHIVDLEGAKNGDTPNIETVRKIVASSGLFCEIGGGIRNMETVEKYIDAGVKRVILGTAAVSDSVFLEKAVLKYPGHIAVGIDIKDGYAAIKGWTEKSEYKGVELCRKMQDTGVLNIIVTDISKDGAMKGTNIALYEELKKSLDINITASGGVSSIEDVKKLSETGLYGAIIGKAYYIGAISLKEAIEVAK